MLYFSELKGKKVFTEKGTLLGRLDDLVFFATGQPLVTKLTVRGPKNYMYTIPVSYTRKSNGVIVVSHPFRMETLSENELYVGKNLLDQQIIDIGGNKIVRVNDIAIQDKPNLIIEGVDIGVVGILRWFGVDETFGKILRLLGKTVTSRFLSWADIQPLQLTRGRVVLKKEQKKLSKLKPEDLADHMENLSLRNSSRFLDLMDDEFAAQVVESLHVTYQQNLFKRFTPERSAKLIERMEPDEAVDVLLALSEKRRAHIIAHLSTKKRAELHNLLSLSHTAIGALITTDFFTANPEDTAIKTRNRIQKETSNIASLPYVYTVNKQNQLVGVLSLHELLMAQNDTPLYRFMTPSPIVIHLTTPVEIAIRRMLKYKIGALPVINDKKEMLGIITFDDLESIILSKM